MSKSVPTKPNNDQPAIMLKTLWNEVGFSPNPQQKAAILHVDGPLYLPAGPGSGKTRVLLWRVVNLLVNHDVPPAEVFLSTFTEKAALQLKEGLRVLLGLVTERTKRPFDLAKMYVGTIHSLCQTLLTDRRFSPDHQRTRPPVLMDDLGQYLYVYQDSRWKALLAAAGIGTGANQDINAFFSSFLKRPSKSTSRHEAVNNIIGLFNRFSEECLSPKQAKRRATDRFLVQLIDLYREYLVSLEDEEAVARMDFPLVQQKAIQCLDSYENSGNVFRHVIIDEYQDTNTVQERLFFKLAAGHKNLCVVGDDDQALYRFRGATVENFVDFPARCKTYLEKEPRRIVLGKNYRSRQGVVDFFNAFMTHPSCDWRKKARSGQLYRVDKKISAERKDPGVAVIASTPAEPPQVCSEIAQLVRSIIDEEKVDDPNQIAFLFPSLKSRQVGRMQEALESVGLKVYAPRAGTFLEVPESVAMFGLIAKVFGNPKRADLPGADYNNYHDWLEKADSEADNLMRADRSLGKYVKDRNAEARKVVADYESLIQVADDRQWSLDRPYDPNVMRGPLLSASGLSAQTKRSLGSPYFDKLVRRRIAAGKPFYLKYVINRATSLDWSILDLFYQICGFKHFRDMFDLAESGKDEGPVCNLSLISSYLNRFMDQYAAIVSGQFLSGNRFVNVLMGSYLYALYRRGESEYEDAEDPFPRGRIPFITIHQAKGLEFPVVVMGNPRKDGNSPQTVEQLVQPLLQRKGEPLDRMAAFDIMRMFYVAISRAKNLLVIAHYKGRGLWINSPFGELIEDSVTRIADFSVGSLPKAELKENDDYRSYSYTGDYLLYKKCPRQYMLFRKYSFVPSRTQTMLFGSLVHETLEDLHQYLIAQKAGK